MTTSTKTLTRTRGSRRPASSCATYVSSSCGSRRMFSACPMRGVRAVFGDMVANYKRKLAAAASLVAAVEAGDEDGEQAAASELTAAAEEGQQLASRLIDRLRPLRRSRGAVAQAGREGTRPRGTVRQRVVVEVGEVASATSAAAEQEVGLILVFIAVAVAGAVLTNGTGAFGFAVVNAVLGVWSNGVMANYRRDPHNMPNLAVRVSLVTTLAGVGFIIAGLVME